MQQKTIDKLTEQNQLLLETTQQKKPSFWQRLIGQKTQTRELGKSGILQVHVDCFTSTNNKPNHNYLRFFLNNTQSIVFDNRKLHLTIQKSHKTWIIPPLTKHKYHTMVIYSGNSEGNSLVKQKWIDGKIVVSSILTRLQIHRNNHKTATDLRENSTKNLPQSSQLQKLRFFHGLHYRVSVERK